MSNILEESRRNCRIETETERSFLVNQRSDWFWNREVFSAVDSSLRLVSMLLIYSSSRCRYLPFVEFVSVRINDIYTLTKGHVMSPFIYEWLAAKAKLSQCEKLWSNAEPSRAEPSSFKSSRFKLYLIKRALSRAKLPQASHARTRVSVPAATFPVSAAREQPKVGENNSHNNPNTPAGVVSTGRKNKRESAGARWSRNLIKTRMHERERERERESSSSLAIWKWSNNFRKPAWN